MKRQKLDTHDYQTLFDTAKQQFEVRSGTTIQASDIAYTMLEAGSMLNDMLNYYMESVEERHLEKQQKLLYGEEQKCAPHCYLPCSCQTLLSIKKSEIIAHQKDSVLQAYDPITLYPWDIMHSYFIYQQEIQCIDDFLLASYEGFQIMQVEQGDAFYFAFQHPFLKDHPSAITFEIKSQRETIAREHFFQKEWKWQYYSMHGWQDFDVEDDTLGFRYHGQVRFQIHKHMEQCINFEERAFWIRAVCENVCENHSIVITHIWLNTIHCEQMLTLAHTLYFNDQEKIFSHDAYDQFYLQARTEQGWKNISYKQKQIENGIQFYPSKGYTHYRLIQQKKQLSQMISTLDITGVSSQKIVTGECYALRISIEDEQGQLQDYPLYTCATVNRGPHGAIRLKDGIRFGNGRDFLIPKRKHQGLYILEMQLRCEPVKSGFISNDDHLMISQPVWKQQKNKELYHFSTPSQVEESFRKIPGCLFEQIKVKEADDGWNVYFKDSSHRMSSHFIQTIYAYISTYLPLGIALHIHVEEKS